MSSEHQEQECGAFCFHLAKKQTKNICSLFSSLYWCHNRKIIHWIVLSATEVHIFTFNRSSRWLLTSYRWRRRSEYFWNKLNDPKHFSAENKSQPWDITLQPSGTSHRHLNHDQKGLVILFWHVGAALQFTQQAWVADFPWGRKRRLAAPPTPPPPPASPSLSSHNPLLKPHLFIAPVLLLSCPLTHGAYFFTFTSVSSLKLTAHSSSPVSAWVPRGWTIKDSGLKRMISKLKIPTTWTTRRIDGHTTRRWH